VGISSNSLTQLCCADGALQTFGGDFFMEQQVGVLRGFFTAFFSLDKETWGGFLAGWPGLPHNELHATWDARLRFAMAMFTKMPNDVRMALVRHAVQYTWQYGPNTLLRSLAPSVAESTDVSDSGRKSSAQGTAVEERGVPDVKEEARRMMKAFVPTLFEEQPQRDGAESKAVVSDTVTPDSVLSVGSFPSPFN
jgi:lycopene beta-cyclase